MGWCAQGVGYVCSVGAPPSLSAVLTGFVVCFCTGFLAGNAPTLLEAQGSWPLRLALDLSFGRWSAECLCVCSLARQPGAYQAQLGSLFLDQMGVRPACEGAGSAQAQGAPPSDYSLVALLDWSQGRGGGVLGGRAACARSRPLRAVCLPHLLALGLIGLALRLLAAALLLRATRERQREPTLCAEPWWWLRAHRAASWSWEGPPDRQLGRADVKVHAADSSDRATLAPDEQTRSRSVPAGGQLSMV